MARRVSLPSADDLFRSTGEGGAQPAADPVDLHRAARRARHVAAVPDVVPDPEPVDDELPEPTPVRRKRRPVAEKKPSGRVRHDEKMTVYITSDELLDIEHARLLLRSTHGLAVDRGRLVREALAITLADFEANGEDSVLVQRLIQP
ncbi:hypothetical protein [Nocardioides speluncae]|uniref:hypothetical protein n=1 Tax=Nocardioides speluncae TaxID=2670337 RepID=UPI000D68EB57|nr:hypothetical protein [Nocardioides speluncae]